MRDLRHIDWELGRKNFRGVSYKISILSSIQRISEPIPINQQVFYKFLQNNLFAGVLLRYFTDFFPIQSKNTAVTLDIVFDWCYNYLDRMWIF